MNSRLHSNYTLLLAMIMVFSILFTTSYGLKGEIDDGIVLQKDTVEDFQYFYARFGNDSVFQLQRVEFPLPGYNLGLDYNPEIKDSNFHWSKKDWVLHSAIDTNSKYFEFEFERTDSLVIERVLIPNSGFETIRKFKRRNTKWFLVFYGVTNL